MSTEARRALCATVVMISVVAMVGGSLLSMLWDSREWSLVAFGGGVCFLGCKAGYDLGGGR